MDTERRDDAVRNKLHAALEAGLRCCFAVANPLLSERIWDPLTGFSGNCLTRWRAFLKLPWMGWSSRTNPFGPLEPVKLQRRHRPKKCMRLFRNGSQGDSMQRPPKIAESFTGQLQREAMPMNFLLSQTLTADWIGGASLNVSDFLAIVAAAEKH